MKYSRLMYVFTYVEYKIVIFIGVEWWRPDAEGWVLLVKECKVSVLRSMCLGS